MHDETAARLRGSEPQSLDARTIERASRSGCNRYRTSVAIGMHPRRLAAATFGEAAIPYDISPFARAIGVAFERWLLDRDGVALKNAYEAMTDWRPEKSVNLNPLLDSRRQDEAQRQTSELVKRRLETGEGPDVIFGVVVPLETPSGVTHIRPDMLVARPGERQFRVGEIKSYLDLGGRTEGTEVGTAVRQAAVGVIAMERQFGSDSVDRQVDLVLRTVWRPGATVRTMDASMEVTAIEDFLDSSTKVIQDADAQIASGVLSDEASLLQIPHRFEPACEGACALYEACRAEAIDRDELSILGLTAEAALEGVSTLSRAMELARGANPASGAEASISRVLRAAWAASELVEAKGD